MVAYFFPPLGGAGSLRPFKLAKYLPRYGWTPIVLTVSNPDWYYAYDPDLLSELPQNAKVAKSLMLKSVWSYRFLNPIRFRKVDSFLGSYIFHPDPQVGWIPLAYLKAKKLLKENKVHAIYSTSAPLSCHLIAAMIKKKTGLPWIADFRDEWYENPSSNYPNGFYRKLHYTLEGRIVNSCNKVIAAAPTFNKLLAKHCDDKNKFSTITMGFDPDDFEIDSCSKESIANNKFTITFSGLFYKSFNPSILLKAARDLIREGKIISDKIKILFVGANTPDELDFQNGSGICEFTGFVDHRVALKYLRNTDVLLLLLSDKRGKDVIPSKTFEYLAVGKPILALIPPDGEVAKIIQKCRAGIVVDYENYEEIKTSLYALYCRWEAGDDTLSPDKDEIFKYNQVNITEKFADLLNSLSNQPMNN